MDGYPKELIEGVTPLIFAVDAVFRNEDDNANTNSNQKSTAFETFYNFITRTGNIKAEKDKVHVQPSDPLTGVFHRSSNANVNANNKSKPSDFFNHANIVPVSHRHALPPSKDPHGNHNAVAKLNSALYAARRQKFVPSHQHQTYSHVVSANTNANSTSGPNSNSATGDGNGTNANAPNATNSNSFSSKSNNNNKPTYISPIASILSKTPIQGILPSGWIEKHTHALPSTLLVVTTLDLTNTPYQQALLEKQLSASIENITSSCAGKRACPVHLVCLVQYGNKYKGIGTPKELAIENERMGSIKSVCRLGNGSVTALHYFEEDVYANAAPGTKHTIFVQADLQKLQKAVEGESMLYYLTQVRRCKRKHSLLHHGKFEDLLPFAARYCMKIAVFYEFQGVADTDRVKKSSKYWAEAYKNVQDYYLHLQGESETNRVHDVHVHGNVLPAYAGKNLMDMETESQLTGATSISSAGGGGGREDGDGDAGGTAAISEGDNMTSTRSQEIEGGEDGLALSPPPPPSPGVPPSSSDDGVEVALVYSPKSGNGKLTVDPPKLLSEGSKEFHEHISNDWNVMTHSEDMLQQCRAVADLLNIKLLLTDYAMALRSLSNFTSGKESPEDVTFAHIAKQIRTHSQIFLSTPSSLSASPSISVGDPSWLFLAYVARQRLVISEFLQRYPIRVPSNHLTTLDKETPVYCNAFHHYISCGEAFLRLGASVKRARSDWQTGKDSQVDTDGNDGRQRYVGCLGSQDLVVAWNEESSRDHQGKKTVQYSTYCSPNCFIFFKVGFSYFVSLALALGYFEIAVEMLTTDQSSGSSSKLLARAYYLTSGIFMKKGDYHSALRHLKLMLPLVDDFPSIRVAAEITMRKCLEKCSDEQPAKSSAALLLDCSCNRLLSSHEITALQKSLSGNTTKVPWLYNSESSQPLHYSFTFPSCSYVTEGDTVVGTMHLHSNLPFQVKIETISLDMSAGSVAFESTDMCYIQPNETIRMSTKVSIPNGCMKDVDGKTLERQMVKKPRRNTFGLTKIGGGVYVKDMDNKLSGGLCISCLGADITLSFPDSNNTRLAVHLKNHHRGSFPISSQDVNEEPDKKRISLEEDNFVYSAWSRPDFFPMHSGPRCIRILRAQSQLEIIDLTSPLVNSKAMIGTVNKFLLKLKAGSMEQCRNVKMRVTCSSWLDMGGSSEDSAADTGEAVNSENIDTEMLPVLVTSSPYEATADDEFVLPRWKKTNGNLRDGQSYNEWVTIGDNLNCGSEMFCSFELYKPLPLSGRHEEFQCKTKFTVDISYNQVRLDQSNVEQNREPVIQTYRGTIAWCSPFDAEFRVLSRKQGSTPSGSRHPANTVGSHVSAADNIAVLSGNFVAVTCSLQSPEAANNLAAEVGHIEFEVSRLMHVFHILLEFSAFPHDIFYSQTSRLDLKIKSVVYLLFTRIRKCLAKIFCMLRNLMTFVISSRLGPD